MLILENVHLKNFSIDDLNNRELIIEMLKYEDQLYLSEVGQNIMIQHGNNLTNNHGSKSIQRLTLIKFNFNSDDICLEYYRNIINVYYESPNNYDAEVLNSVYYLRENRCLYYKTKNINIGDKIPNVKIHTLDSKENDLFNFINTNNNYTIVAGFSMS